MTNDLRFAARPLDVVDVPAALDLSLDAGAHGVYVHNVLVAHQDLGKGVEVIGFFCAEGLVGLAYFGPRGNLLVLLRAQLDPGQVARAIVDALWHWRIVLASSPVVDQLVRISGLEPLVNREQIYYRMTREELDVLALPEGTSDVRRAEKRDLECLMDATLHLNESDLRVDRWLVDKTWLRRNTKTRIREGTTYVLGPVGNPIAKLDIGSKGPAGVVIEGVYTWRRVRGQGLASVLISAVAAEVLIDCPQVCLHVAASNRAARRAYHKSGMSPQGSCQLMLRG